MSENRYGDSLHAERHVITAQTEEDLVNEIRVMFFDAMTVPCVPCVPSDYAKSVIHKVRCFDAQQRVAPRGDDFHGITGTRSV